MPLDLHVARLRGHLGETLHEANANNFSVAADRATVFFDALREAVASPQFAAVKGKLSEMYMQFGGAVAPAS